MSTPVLLSALTSLQTALRSIAVASGYHYTVKSTSVVLDPVALVGVAGTEVPFMVLDEPKLYNEGGTSRPVAVKSHLDLMLRVRIDAPDNTPDGKSIAAWQMYADIEKAAIVDPQRGGVALYTFVDWENNMQIYLGLPPNRSAYLEIPIRILLQRVYGVA